MSQLVRVLRLSSVLQAIGTLLILAAVGWWASVFLRVTTTTSLDVQEAVSCLFSVSDACRLGMALCTASHWLAPQRYSAELLWIGLAIAAAGVIAHARHDPSVRESRGERN